MGLCIALMAGLLVGGAGCARKTPEQKAQAKAQKAAVAQAKAEKKAAEKQAKAQAKAEKQRLEAAQDRAEAQAKAAKKQAEAQAKADKKRTAEQRDQAEAQAKSAQKQAEAQAKVDREKAAEQARIEQQKAAAQARLDHENAEAAAVAQRRQAQMAMAEAKSNEAATKKAAKESKKSKSSKKEKPVVYEDDKVDVVGNPYHKPENDTYALDRMFEGMSAAGAVDDATLYDQHFDGGELNSLGRSKVALMLEAAPKNEPLTIYIPTAGSDERAQSRMDAVNKFWKDSQFVAVQMQTKQGVNPNNTSPASIGLAGLRKLDKEQNGGTSSGSSSSGSGSSGASSGSTSR
jgi:hypothetical protein